MTDLTENEHVAKRLMPATSTTLSETMGVTQSYVWDLVSQMRGKGVDIRQDAEGRYYVEGEHQPEEATYIDETTLTSDSKGTITRNVKQHIAEMEHELISLLEDTDPPRAELPVTEGAEDLIIHRTDDHFGELITNQHGEEVFNSEIAEERVDRVFEEALATAEKRRDRGTEFDTAHLLLGGDIVTNEAIYEGQAHEIDATLNEQIDRAANVYVRGLKQLSDAFPAVQVVCQPGNHGRMGSGNPSNADSILYSVLDRVVRESDADNVQVLQSDRSYYVDFSIRGWNAHLRHGHDASLEHIGTSAGKQRWLSWLVDHNFDIAFRGHYHALKEEPINGVPVVMGGSIVPQTEFEESKALSGRAIGAIHGASDEYPLEWSERIVFH